MPRIPFTSSTCRLVARLAAGVVIASSTLVAQSHLTPELYEEYLREGSLEERVAFMKSLGNHQAKPELLAQAQYRLQKQYLRQQGVSEKAIALMAPPPAWRGMPTTGPVKIFTLLIDFNDYPGVTSRGDVEKVVFGSGNGQYPYESLKSYYARSSYGKLAINGSVLGWYRPSRRRSEISQTTAGREALIREALEYFNRRGHDFAQYDNNGDGTIDYFAVVWAGPNNGWGRFWWGYQTDWSMTNPVKLDGKLLKSYSWQWERYNAYDSSERYEPSTLIHETGHALGLPDYYDYDENKGPDGGLGQMDMMDGNWGDHNAFSKFLLDWLTPTLVNKEAVNVTLHASSEAPEAVVMMPNAPTDGFGEFFLIDYRRRALNDAGLPNDGLLVWHVDAQLNGKGDYLYDNSFTSHKLLRLMEADGLEEIERYPNRKANAGDFFTNGQVFGPATSPRSHRYDGTATNMVLSNIGITGATAVFNISTETASDTTAPVVAAYVQGVRGTIQLRASARDNVGTTKVEFYVDDQLKGEATTVPYVLPFDSATLSEGSHVLTVKGYDAAGNMGTSEGFSFQVANGPDASLIRNGGFEYGRAFWSGKTNRIGVWGGAYAGNVYARLGGQGKAWSRSKAKSKKKSKETLMQSFTIPAAFMRSQLVFALKVTSAEGMERSRDTLVVELLRAQKNKVIRKLAQFSNQNTSDGYALYTFDLSAYRGQSLKVRFTSTENATFATRFHIDEVAVVGQ